jgi:hypothetical protein
MPASVAVELSGGKKGSSSANEPTSPRRKGAAGSGVGTTGGTWVGTFPLVAAGLGLLMCVAVFESGGDMSRAARGGFMLQVDFVPQDQQPLHSTSGSTDAVIGSSDQTPMTLPTHPPADASGSKPPLTRSQIQTGLTLKERKKLQKEEQKNKKPKQRDAWRNEIIRLHPRVNLCEPVNARLKSAVIGDVPPATYLGCFYDSNPSGNTARHEAVELGDDPADNNAGKLCAQKCASKIPAVYAHLEAGGKCSCLPTFGKGGIAPDVGCGGKGTKQVYTVGVWPPEASTALAPDPVPGWIKEGSGPEHNTTVNVFIWANPRLAAMFRTCRLGQLSTRFTYDVYDLRHQVRNANETQVAELFRIFPGPKVIVFDGCCVPGWLLLKWPEISVLIIASDESARWGYTSTNGKNPFYNGPHDPHGPPGGIIPEDHTPDHRILMPESTKPWFKQYYSERHLKDFGNEVRYIPLGSREEFSEVKNGYKPSTRRKYLYSFMGAPTDISRKKVRDVLLADSTIDKNRTFLYMAESWDADPNSDRNTYIKPTEYRKIMMDSVFTLCPKGHSIEQFRMYEAIESGSIPIIAMEGDCPGGCPNYAAERLPPEYLTSPMVVVQNWDDVVAKLHDLESNHTALLERQAALQRWYVDYMHNKIVEIEDVLIEKMHKAHLLH